MIVKDMTPRIILENNARNKLANRVETLKSLFWTRAKTLENALNAEDAQSIKLWTLVSETWPETKGMKATIRKDNTIVFTETK